MSKLDEIRAHYTQPNMHYADYVCECEDCERGRYLLGLIDELETNRDRVMRGEVVRVSDKRLREMQEEALDMIKQVRYHWHWAAIVNELLALRKIVAAVAKEREIDISGGTEL